MTFQSTQLEQTTASILISAKYYHGYCVITMIRDIISRFGKGSTIKKKTDVVKKVY